MSEVPHVLSSSDAVASSQLFHTEMCSGSEAGLYLRLIDFKYHSNLGSRVIKKKKKCQNSTPKL
jgi:hypothetical protein